MLDYFSYGKFCTPFGTLDLTTVTLLLYRFFTII